MSFKLYPFWVIQQLFENWDVIKTNPRFLILRISRRGDSVCTHKFVKAGFSAVFLFRQKQNVNSMHSKNQEKNTIRPDLLSIDTNGVRSEATSRVMPIFYSCDNIISVLEYYKL